MGVSGRVHKARRERQKLDGKVIYCLIDTNKLFRTLLAPIMLFNRQLQCIIKLFWFIIFVLSAVVVLNNRLIYHARLFISKRKIDMILTSSCLLFAVRLFCARAFLRLLMAYQLQINEWKMLSKGNWCRRAIYTANIINHAESRWLMKALQRLNVTWYAMKICSNNVLPYKWFVSLKISAAVNTFQRQFSNHYDVK